MGGGIPLRNTLAVFRGVGLSATAGNGGVGNFIRRIRGPQGGVNIASQASGASKAAKAPPTPVKAEQKAECGSLPPRSSVTPVPLFRPFEEDPPQSPPLDVYGSTEGPSTSTDEAATRATLQQKPNQNPQRQHQLSPPLNAEEPAFALKPHVSALPQAQIPAKQNPTNRLPANQRPVHQTALPPHQQQNQQAVRQLPSQRQQQQKPHPTHAPRPLHQVQQSAATTSPVLSQSAQSAAGSSTSTTAATSLVAPPSSGHPTQQPAAAVYAGYAYPYGAPTMPAPLLSHAHAGWPGTQAYSQSYYSMPHSTTYTNGFPDHPRPHTHLQMQHSAYMSHGQAAGPQQGRQAVEVIGSVVQRAMQTPAHRKPNSNRVRERVEAFSVRMNR
uniref:Uncharacterized protein n=1 Tax=Chromera velia CCMP2878 TaxID=1169474 RepID=A0A0G4F4D0_9ALVE|eukprot:Cvel_15040.t1-p1 / transcript=Cvel_15040.t1 / gene=Cvel_15040 / organism=Chromera_velia_CCMP2878 / gene_product=hypothetical protein / transcript_product=hypothetical protein / location=Cvel_scaffold1095:28115-29263(+) / protein_length=383 / sequence_SO=supercontig / SO=protein_coding / is_pseudo=false